MQDFFYFTTNEAVDQFDVKECTKQFGPLIMGICYSIADIHAHFEWFLKKRGGGSHRFDVKHEELQEN